VESNSLYKFDLSIKKIYIMATKKKTKRGRKQDAKLVAGNQKHEVKAVAKKTKKSAKKVRAAVKKVGPSRKKVEKELGEDSTY